MEAAGQAASAFVPAKDDALHAGSADDAVRASAHHAQPSEGPGMASNTDALKENNPLLANPPVQQHAPNDVSDTDAVCVPQTPDLAQEQSPNRKRKQPGDGALPHDTAQHPVNSDAAAVQNDVPNVLRMEPPEADSPSISAEELMGKPLQSNPQPAGSMHEPASQSPQEPSALAIGGSQRAPGPDESSTVQVLKAKGVPEEHILFLNLIASPEGVDRFAQKFPKLRVVTAFIDQGLDEKK